MSLVVAARPPRRGDRRRHARCRRDHSRQRLRGLIVVLWRAGLRISEALALAEADLDSRRGAVLVRRGGSLASTSICEMGSY